MSPPGPEDDVPVAMRTLPEVPFVLFPVTTLMSPERPWKEAAAVPTSTVPLPLTPAPETTFIAPPTLPALKDTPAVIRT